MSEEQEQAWWNEAKRLNETPTQETQVNETTQELPAVVKLREAFDTARNALIDGSELAKLVTELRENVKSLSNEVSSLRGDLEYVRNRNRELDEQVSQVRVTRDIAIAEAQDYADRARTAEALLTEAQTQIENQRVQLSGMYDRIDALKKERDDAQMAQMEMEDKLKAAQGKLATIEALFVGQTIGAAQERPKPHYLDQPRDEVGKFQPPDSGSQGTY